MAFTYYIVPMRKRYNLSPGRYRSEVSWIHITMGKTSKMLAELGMGISRAFS